MGYEAFVLSADSREQLMTQFPPRHDNVVGHHVTHRFGVPRALNVPYGERTHGWFEVVGRVNHNGVEALVVSVNGKTIRPDGRRYHITWSLAAGKKPVDSNAVLDSVGFTPFATPVKFWATFDYLA